MAAVREVGVEATMLRVDGYTDDKGDDGYNRTLSRRRAVSVLKALKKQVTRPAAHVRCVGDVTGASVEAFVVVARLVRWRKMRVVRTPAITAAASSAQEAFFR